MSAVADSIRRGLQEAVSYAAGEADTSTYRVHVPAQVDAGAIRRRLGMTQEEFAARFGVPLDTLRHREHGTRQPAGTRARRGRTSWSSTARRKRCRRRCGRPDRPQRRGRRPPARGAVLDAPDGGHSPTTAQGRRSCAACRRR
jgi:putative transcriptional regulator